MFGTTFAISFLRENNVQFKIILIMFVPTIFNRDAFRNDLLEAFFPFVDVETKFDLPKWEGKVKVKKEADEMTISVPFDKDTETYTSSFDEEKRKFSCSVKSKPGSSCSSVTMLKEYIPEEYDGNYRWYFEKGNVIFIFKKIEEKPCCHKEELEKRLAEVEKTICDLDAKLERWNEKMHDAIDNEEFDLLHDLSEEFRKTDDELKKAEMLRRELKMEETHSKNHCCEDKKECNEKKHECSHNKYFNVKCDKWARDEKGRFVKRH